MNTTLIPKYTFILGAILDTGIAISWLLIASGLLIPNVLSGYQGAGTDYQFAMYISAMFMMGWAIILAWGAFSPIERLGLLPITASLLLVSIIVELSIFKYLLSGGWFVFGIVKRSFLVLLFFYVYFALRKEKTVKHA